MAIINGNAKNQQSTRVEIEMVEKKSLRLEVVDL